jgi:hypothetical protein
MIIVVDSQVDLHLDDDSQVDEVADDEVEEVGKKN